MAQRRSRSTRSAFSLRAASAPTTEARNPLRSSRIAGLADDGASVVRLRSFDLEQRARDRGVVGRDSIELAKRRRPIVAIGFRNHDGNVPLAARLSRAALDTDARARILTFPLDANSHVPTAGKLSAVDRTYGLIDCRMLDHGRHLRTIASRQEAIAGRVLNRPPLRGTPKIADLANTIRLCLEWERAEPRSAAQLASYMRSSCRRLLHERREHVWTKTPRRRPRRLLLMCARDHTFVTSAACGPF